MKNGWRESKQPPQAGQMVIFWSFYTIQSNMDMCAGGEYPETTGKRNSAWVHCVFRGGSDGVNYSDYFFLIHARDGVS